MRLKMLWRQSANQWLIRPSGLVILADYGLMAFGMLTAILAHFRILSVIIFPITTVCLRVAVHTLLGIIAWKCFGIYRRVIRFFYGADYLNIIILIALLHIVSFSTGNFFPKKHQLAAEIFIISFFTTCFYIICNRLVISYLYAFFRRSRKTANQKRVFIFGTNEVAVLLKKNLEAIGNQQFAVLGFLDDSPKMAGRYLEGLKVYDGKKNLRKHLVDLAITDIIIAGKNCSPARKAILIEDTLSYQIKIAELSSAEDLFNSRFSLQQLSKLDINDLMNREPIELFDSHVSEKIAHKCILVTGAAGSIGSEIVRKLCLHNATNLICVDFAESALYNLQQQLMKEFPSLKAQFIVADIRNEQLLHSLFKEQQPQIIYHAAAYKHVPLMEQYPWQAIHTNMIATGCLVKLAHQFNAEKFVFISTDKAVAPTSVMGATKRLAEMIVQSYANRNGKTVFVVTRFGNVLGSNGSVVPLFKTQIESGGPVTVTHPEMTRYFMTIPEACQLVLEASVMANGGEIYVFDMGEPVKIVSLAENMIRLAGLKPNVDIPIVFTGLRPGEKLHESLFSDEVEMQKTYHKKILIAKESLRAKEDAELILIQAKHLQNYTDATFTKQRIMHILEHFETKNNAAFAESMALAI